MLLSMSNHYQTRAPRRQNGAGWTLTLNELELSRSHARIIRINDAGHIKAV